MCTAIRSSVGRAGAKSVYLTCSKSSRMAVLTVATVSFGQ